MSLCVGHTFLWHSWLQYQTARLMNKIAILFCQNSKLISKHWINRIRMRTKRCIF
jgi:hypothetical protein